MASREAEQPCSALCSAQVHPLTSSCRGAPPIPPPTSRPPWVAPNTSAASSYIFIYVSRYLCMFALIFIFPVLPPRLLQFRPDASPSDLFKPDPSKCPRIRLSFPLWLSGSEQFPGTPSSHNCPTNYYQRYSRVSCLIHIKVLTVPKIKCCILVYLCMEGIPSNIWRTMTGVCLTSCMGRLKSP